MLEVLDQSPEQNQTPPNTPQPPNQQKHELVLNSITALETEATGHLYFNRRMNFKLFYFKIKHPHWQSRISLCWQLSNFLIFSVKVKNTHSQDAGQLLTFSIHPLGGYQVTYQIMRKTVFQKANKTQKYQAIIISPNTKGEAQEAQFL